MNFPSSIVSIFELWMSRIGRDAILKSTFTESATLAYSGGKDSSVCLLFFIYLNERYQISFPKIFHMSHGIRSNESQELAIQNYLFDTFPRVIVKKKIFQN